MDMYFTRRRLSRLLFQLYGASLLLSSAQALAQAVPNIGLNSPNGGLINSDTNMPTPNTGASPYRYWMSEGGSYGNTLTIPTSLVSTATVKAAGWNSQMGYNGDTFSITFGTQGVFQESQTNNVSKVSVQQSYQVEVPTEVAVEVPKVVTTCSTKEVNKKSVKTCVETTIYVKTYVPGEKLETRINYFTAPATETVLSPYQSQTFFAGMTYRLNDNWSVSDSISDAKAEQNGGSYTYTPQAPVNGTITTKPGVLKPSSGEVRANTVTLSYSTDLQGLLNIEQVNVKGITSLSSDGSTVGVNGTINMNVPAILFLEHAKLVLGGGAYRITGTQDAIINPSNNTAFEGVQSAQLQYNLSFGNVMFDGGPFVSGTQYSIHKGSWRSWTVGVKGEIRNLFGSSSLGILQRLSFGFTAQDELFEYSDPVFTRRINPAVAVHARAEF